MVLFCARGAGLGLCRGVAVVLLGSSRGLLITALLLLLELLSTAEGLGMEPKNPFSLLQKFVVQRQALMPLLPSSEMSLTLQASAGLSGSRKSPSKTPVGKHSRKTAKNVRNIHQFIGEDDKEKLHKGNEFSLSSRVTY